MKSFGSNPGKISPGRPICRTEVVWKHIKLLVREVGVFIDIHEVGCGGVDWMDLA
jgi:hypothetical protein